MGDTDSTERTVSRYFAAWTARDTPTVRELLAEDYRFSGMGSQVQGRDAFLAAAAFPPDAETSMVVQVCQGSEAFQMYDSSRAGTTVRIVEHLSVEDGRVTSSTLVTDSGAFLAFVGAA